MTCNGRMRGGRCGWSKFYMRTEQRSSCTWKILVVTCKNVSRLWDCSCYSVAAQSAGLVFAAAAAAAAARCNSDEAVYSVVYRTITLVI